MILPGLVLVIAVVVVVVIPCVLDTVTVVVCTVVVPITVVDFSTTGKQAHICKIVIVKFSQLCPSPMTILSCPSKFQL